MTYDDFEKHLNVKTEAEAAFVRAAEEWAIGLAISSFHPFAEDMPVLIAYKQMVAAREKVKSSLFEFFTERG